MLELNFEILFTIEILHKYYHDGVCPDFIITPSEETKQVLRGHKMVWRQYANKLYVGTQSAPLNELPQPQINKPLVELSEDFQLRFYLKCKNLLFYNYTNLPQTVGQSRILYFSNLDDNKSNNKNFLSKSLDAFSDSKTYNPGDIVFSGDLVYEAIKVNNPAPLPGVDQTDSWREVDKNRYVTAEDFLTPVADTPIAKEIKGSDICGVIEIFNSPSVPVGYKLVSPDVPASHDDRFLRPEYSICFLNRATKWKYVLKSITGKSISVASGSATFAFNDFPPNSIMSSIPIPLNDSPPKLKLLDGTTEIAKPLPCASAGNVAKSKIATDPFYYSEIYLNY